MKVISGISRALGKRPYNSDLSAKRTPQLRITHYELRIKNDRQKAALCIFMSENNILKLSTDSLYKL